MTFSMALRYMNNWFKLILLILISNLFRYIVITFIILIQWNYYNFTIDDSQY